MIGGIVGGYLIDKYTKPVKEITKINDTKVDIHVLTYNEEDYVEETLKTINRQPLYRKSDNVKLILVDSKSTDNTQEIASNYVDDIWETPRGKVTSRDEAYRRSNADIIVHTDADIKVPKYWLSNLIKPFKKPNIVAVQGPSLTEDPIYKPAKGLWIPIDYIRRKLLGQNVAIARKAYINSGGYNTNIDETTFRTIQREEEFRLYKLMKSQGEIEYVLNAPVYSSTRRRKLSLEKINNTKSVKKHKNKTKTNKTF